jgi:hypothetical protein
MVMVVPPSMEVKTTSGKTGGGGSSSTARANPPKGSNTNTTAKTEVLFTAHMIHGSRDGG